MSEKEHRTNLPGQRFHYLQQKNETASSTSGKSASDKEKFHLHEFARREIEHFIDQVCSYLFSEEQFTNYVRQRLREEIYRRVKRKLKKLPTPTQALSESLRSLGQPVTIARRYTIARRKLQFPWAETFYILMGILSIKFKSGSKDEFFKEISSLVLYLLFLLIPVLVYVAQMFMAPEFEVTSEGLFYNRALKHRIFISWNSIVALKVRWRLLVGRYVAIYLSNRQKIALLPVTTNFAYVISCLLAHATPHTKIDPGVRAILQKHIGTSTSSVAFQDAASV